MATDIAETGSKTIPGTGFTKAHDLFRQSVRKFIDQEINPFMDEWEEAEIFPAHELFKKAGDLGLLGLSYPEEYGGTGADYWYNIAPKRWRDATVVRSRWRSVSRPTWPLRHSANMDRMS